MQEKTEGFQVTWIVIVPFIGVDELLSSQCIVLHRSSLAELCVCRSTNNGCCGVDKISKFSHASKIKALL